MSRRDDFDYWRPLQKAQSKPVEAVLKIKTIEGIEPLVDQLGVDQHKTVPVPLYEPFFGQPKSTAVKLATPDSRPTEIPSLQTYAILDAAKVANLPELLAASQLEYNCLFSGTAYDELKNVAPWVVRLEEGSAFTRHLFTRSDAPWHLWDKEPGIYFRSYHTLEKVSDHFQLYARICDTQKKCYFFRFWEQKYFLAYLRAGDSNEQSHLFSKIHSFQLILKERLIVIMRETALDEPDDFKAIPTLSENHISAFRLVKWNCFLDETCNWLYEKYPFQVNIKDPEVFVRKAAEVGKYLLGSDEASVIADFVAACWLYESIPENGDFFQMAYGKRPGAVARSFHHSAFRKWKDSGHRGS